MKPRNSYVKVSNQPLQNNTLMYQQFARELSKNLHYMFPALASAKKEPIKVSELSKDDMKGIRVVFGGKTTVAMKDVHRKMNITLYLAQKSPSAGW